jgi:hypothetical protein
MFDLKKKGFGVLRALHFMATLLDPDQKSRDFLIANYKWNDKATRDGTQIMYVKYGSAPGTQSSSVTWYDWAVSELKREVDKFPRDANAGDAAGEEVAAPAAKRAKIAIPKQQKITVTNTPAY